MHLRRVRAGDSAPLRRRTAAPRIQDGPLSSRHSGGRTGARPRQDRPVLWCRANDHRTGRGRGRGDQPSEWETGSSGTCVAFSGGVSAGFAAAFRLRVALAVFAASLRFLAEALAFLVAAALTAASLRFFAAALAFLVAAALFAEALRFRVAAALFAAALRSVAFFMARSIAPELCAFAGARLKARA